MTAPSPHATAPPPSNLHHQHMDHRLLAPDGIDGVADAALDRAGDEIGVSTLAARQALESLEDRRIDQRVDRCALARALRQTGDHHVGIAGHFALRRERERDRDDAREGELAALNDAFVACRQYYFAVLVSAGGGGFCPHTRGP